MESFALAAAFLFALFALLGAGVWVGLALMGAAYIGMALFTDRPAGDAAATAIWGSASSWSLTALPLFIWMGEILHRTRLAQELFRGLAPWLAGLPGRLLHTNIVGCAVFAAISGSSAATLATVGKISIPELKKRGYPEDLVLGTLAGAATLGLMIPPSLTLIVYGVSVNESISKLFIAGIVPGLVLAALFMGYVALWSLARPGRIPSEPRVGWRARIAGSRALAPILALIALVMGSIYLGYATATEAAAIGVAGALALAWRRGEMSRETFFASLRGATRTTAMIALILSGAAFLSLAMGFTGLPRALAEWISSLGLTRLELIVALTLFYIVIGCFLDGISAVVLTMAVVEPMIRAAGIDLIWFGIFVVVVVEMAQITPPVGFNLFVLHGMTGRGMWRLARCAAPMFLLMVVMVGILVAFPEIATWLPERMRNAPGG